MSSYPPVKKPTQDATATSHKIRIVLSSRKVPALERACTDLVKRAKDEQLRVKGPIRMPTKTLRITTMKSPCGEGTITFDRFQMRVHKRVIDLVSPSEVVKKITSINIESGVDVEVTVADA
ncbi:uS10 - 40S ribosomal protein S20 [Diplonema papillatum]|nr:uS10 - 40S ribosomal protein S20 [Diplonema papillatum]